MNIDQNTAKNLSNLIEQKDELEKTIELNFQKILPQIKETRAKYRQALDELRKEFDTQYGFYGFGSDADLEFYSITDNETYCTIRTYNRFNDGDGEIETIKIPYLKDQEDLLLKEFKESKKKEYIEEMEKAREEKRRHYLQLKKELGE